MLPCARFLVNCCSLILYHLSIALPIAACSSLGLSMSHLLIHAFCDIITLYSYSLRLVYFLQGPKSNLFSCLLNVSSSLLSSPRKETGSLLFIKVKSYDIHTVGRWLGAKVWRGGLGTPPEFLLCLVYHCSLSTWHTVCTHCLFVE